MIMENGEDPAVAVRKDLANLSRVLKPDDLNPEVMFSKTRGIRSVTPTLGTTSKSSVSVSEQLRRVRMPAD
jgi:hypothetical protein